MNEMVNEGKRRAAVPVDSGVQREGRHRSDAPPQAGDTAQQERSTRRWFGRR